MISKIRTFFALPIAHKLIFIKIVFFVSFIQISLKTIKFKRTFRFLKFFTKENLRAPENERQIVRRHKNFQYLFHKQMPYLGKCLARSLTLWFLLKRKGIETDLKFGMKKKNNQLLAHSWLEYKSKVLITESEINDNYVPFSESILTKI